MRVGVPDSLFGLPTATGRGRMWHEVLQRLEHRASVVRLVGARRERLPGRLGLRLDVVLFDGHTGPRPEAVPQVIQLHEAPWANPETMQTLDAGFLAPVVGPSQAAAEVASAVVCPSTSARDEIVSFHGVAPRRIVVAHHGVDHDTFRPGAPGGRATVVAHGGDPDRPWILFVGALHPRKGVPLLREAFGQLAALGLPHQLVMVGGPAHGRPDAAALTAAYLGPIAGAPGRLVSVPFGCTDAELAGLMAGASVLCLPSFSEGFGLPVAEAAACGTPSVGADRGSIPEIIGPGGLLVEPQVDQLVEALRRVCADEDLARRLGSAGIQHARQFTWDHCADGWFRALELGVEGPPPTRGEVRPGPRLPTIRPEEIPTQR